MATAAAEPTPRCPKCDAARAGAAPACPRCGLSADRMDGYAAARDADVPAAVAAAWERVVASWDEPAGHDALLALISQHGAYAWGAARYRDAARERPGDPVAARQLERLRRATELTLLATATRPKDRTAGPYRASTAVLVVLVVAALAGLLYATVVGDRRPAGDAPPAATPTK